MNINDICVVYEGTPTFEFGAVVQIVDRDGNEPDQFAVATLQEVGKCRHDYEIYDYVKWVHKDNLKVVDYTKPQSLWKRLFG